MTKQDRIARRELPFLRAGTNPNSDAIDRVMQSS